MKDLSIWAGILACPACGASPLGPRMSCVRCGVVYGTLGNGIPELLSPASKSVLAEGLAPQDSPAPNALKRTLGPLVRRVNPEGSCFDAGGAARVVKFLAHLGPGARVVDLGSGTRRLSSDILNVDVGPFPNVDIVADAHRLPFVDNSLDAVVCTFVLEHVNNPWKVIAEMRRVIKPDGKAYVSLPFIQGFHVIPGTHQDFHRFTYIGFEQLMSPFEKMDSGICGGPSSALSWILREYLALLFFDGGIFYSAAYLVSGWLTFWIKYLDVFFQRREKAKRIACGFYYIGVKR